MWKIDIAAIVRIPVAILALMATLHTPLFWLVLYIVLEREISIWIKFRKS